MAKNKLKNIFSSKEFNLSSIFQIKDSTLYRMENSTTVLIFDMEENVFYRLTEGAAFIWSLFDGKTSIEKIAKVYAPKVRVSQEVAVKSISKLVNELFLQNLIEIADANREAQPTGLMFSPKIVKSNWKNLKPLKKAKHVTDLAAAAAAGAGGPGTASSLS